MSRASVDSGTSISFPPFDLSFDASPDFSLDLAALDDLLLSASLEGTSMGSFSAEVPPDLSFVGRMSDSL